MLFITKQCFQQAEILTTTKGILVFFHAMRIKFDRINVGLNYKRFYSRNFIKFSS